jgi:hypothetical protein
LVTDVDYNKETGELYILGYSSFLQPFVKVHVITDTVFSTASNTIPLEIGLAQVEGISNDGNAGYYISCEFFSRESPNITSASRLFRLIQDAEVEPEPEPEPEPQPNEGEKLLVYKEMPSTMDSFLPRVLQILRFCRYSCSA